MRWALSVLVVSTAMLASTAFDRGSVEAPPDVIQPDFDSGLSYKVSRYSVPKSPFDRSSVESGWSDVSFAETYATGDKKNVICYFSNWASFREDQGKFVPENIDASLCTHVFYAFASLDPQQLEIVPASPRNDIDGGIKRDQVLSGRCS